MSEHVDVSKVIVNAPRRARHYPHTRGTYAALLGERRDRLSELWSLNAPRDIVRMGEELVDKAFVAVLHPEIENQHRLEEYQFYLDSLCRRLVPTSGGYCKLYDGHVGPCTDDWDVATVLGQEGDCGITTENRKGAK